ncbi:agmatine deiminase family protein [Streptomyces albicerus]|uniref:agmatine deiminase family protein n=1 Tax=Streptomyces albicerus TaxID=2569859 RepID=UPI00124AF742|nr:agmatine deiminase family protein [Streptomyces albicerus]
MTWTMPPETAPQDRVWLSFPAPGSSALGDTPELNRAGRLAWAAVANAAVRHEPVTVVVDPGEETHARRLLDSAVDVVVAALDDAWIRDNGPTFVHAQDGSVAAVDWVFNGWGRQEWSTWEKDARVGALVADLAGTPKVGSTLVNEGGGIVVDGNGTVVVTETVQLDPHRNPGLGKAEVEAELRDKLGVRQVLWLRRGLARDTEMFGTRGHADLLVAFPSPGTVLVHTQGDPEHPDHEVSREIREVFERSTDADGNPWRIVELPAPQALTDEEGFVDYSYINHLVVNGAVIACSFQDPHDEVALSVLAEEYAGREIVALDARPIFGRGGGIHCITQHQPSPRNTAAHGK